MKDRKNRSKIKTKSNLFRHLSPTVYTLGIEITDHSLKIAEVAVRKNRKHRLTNFAIEPLPLHCVEEGKINDIQHISLTLGKVLASMKIKTKKVHFVLPSQFVMVRFLQLPELPQKDLQKLIDFEVKHNIYMPFEHAHYDFMKMEKRQSDIHLNIHEVLQPSLEQATEQMPSEQMDEGLDLSYQEAAPSSQVEVLDDFDLYDRLEDETEIETDTEIETEQNENAEKSDILLVATAMDLIGEYTSIAKSNGLKPLSMEIKAMSLYRVIKATHILDEAGTFVVVDMSESMTELCIFDHSQLKITRSIFIDFSEKKVQDSNNFSIACEDLADEIERLMIFFRYTLNNNRNRTFVDIVVTGEVLRLPEIVDSLQEKFTQKVILLSPNGERSDIEDQSGMFSALAVPIGLALRGKQR